MKLSRGIALIQVLLIIALLSVFALYIKQGATKHIRTSELAMMRAEADVELQTAKSILYFNLLTEPEQHSTEQDTTEASDIFSRSETQSLSKQRNYHNTPFRVTAFSTAQIQDQAALLSVNFFATNQLRNLLLNSGSSPKRAMQITDTLLDWLDIDTIPRELGKDNFSSDLNRNGKIVDIKELEAVIDLEAHEKALLYENLSVYSRGDLNVFSASKALLASLTSPEIATQIADLRSAGLLTAKRFVEITGLNNQDGYRLTPSNRLAIKLTTQYKDVTISKESVVKFSPYSEGDFPPYEILIERN